MPLVADEKLTLFALSALEEATAAAHEQPLRRTWALRLALAYLASKVPQRPPEGRWPFIHYWRSLSHPRPQDRWANMNAALNGIYLAVGHRRDWHRVSEFERDARDN